MMTRRTLLASVIGAPVAAALPARSTVVEAHRQFGISEAMKFNLGDYVFDRWLGPNEPYIVIGIEADKIEVLNIKTYELRRWYSRCFQSYEKCAK